MRAKIHWLTKEEGGRSKPPAGVGNPPYATVVKFPGADMGSWSLAVEKIESLSNEYDWIADVHYLFAEAPHESLQAGREFELYEGKKCVASGRIKSPSPNPSSFPIATTAS
jgi:hypothetical protein